MKLEQLVGLSSGDALTVTQEFIDYLQSEGRNAWPFKLGDRATVSSVSVYDMTNEVRVCVVHGDMTTGVGGQTFEVEMVKRMRN